MAVKKERSQWIQKMREVHLLGLVAEFRGGMLFHLTPTFVPPLTCSPCLLSEEKPDV